MDPEDHEYLLRPPPDADAQMRIHTVSEMAAAVDMADVEYDEVDSEEAKDVVGELPRHNNTQRTRHNNGTDSDDPTKRVDVRVRGETIMYMSPAELRTMRTLNYHYTSAGVDARNGLNDARGGANLYADRCETCGLDAEHCKGTHFGTIEHAQPHILQTDSVRIERTLATVCSSCSQPVTKTCSYVAELDIMYGVPSDTQVYFLSGQAHAWMQKAFQVKPVFFEETEPAYPRRLPIWITSDRDLLENKLTVLHIQQTQLAKRFAIIQMNDIILYPRRFKPNWFQKNRTWAAFLEQPLQNTAFLQQHNMALSDAVLHELWADDGSGLPLSQQLLLVQKALFLHHRELARLDGMLILLPVNIIQQTRKLQDQVDLATLTLEGHRSALATFHGHGDEQSTKKHLRLQHDVGRLENGIHLLRGRLEAARCVERELRTEIYRRRWIYARTVDYYRNRGQLHTVFRAEITRRLIAYYTAVGGDTRAANTVATACTFKNVKTKFNAPYKLPPYSLKIGNKREVLETHASTVVPSPPPSTQASSVANHVAGGQAATTTVTNKKIRIINQDTGFVKHVNKQTTAIVKPPRMTKRKIQEQQEQASLRAILDEEEGITLPSSTVATTPTAVTTSVSIYHNDEQNGEYKSNGANHERTTSAQESTHPTDVGVWGASSLEGTYPPPPQTMTVEEAELFSRELKRVGLIDDEGNGLESLPHATSLQGFLCYLPYQRVIPESEYKLEWFSGTYTYRRLVELGKSSYNKYYAGTWENEKRYRLRNEYDLDHALLGHVYRVRLLAEFRDGVDAYTAYLRKLVTSSSKETKRFQEVPHAAFVGIPQYAGHSSSKNHLSILRCCMGAGGCGADVFHVRAAGPQNTFQFIAEHPSRFTNNRVLMDHVVRNQSFEFFSHRILCLLRNIPMDHARRLGYQETRPNWMVRVATVVPAHRIRPQTENAEFKPFFTRQAAKILALEEDISVLTDEYTLLTGQPYFYGAIHEDRFPFEKTYFFIDRDKWVGVEVCACVGDISVTLHHYARWVDTRKTTQQHDFKKLVMYATNASHIASIHQNQLLLQEGTRLSHSPDQFLPFRYLTHSAHTTSFEYRLVKTGKAPRGSKAAALAAAASSSSSSSAIMLSSGGGGGGGVGSGVASENQRPFLKETCFFDVGIEPFTSAEEKYLCKHTDKIFTHTLMLKPHMNGDNANVAKFIGGKYGFFKRHSYTKRAKYTHREILTSAPYTSPMGVLVSSKFMRRQVSLHTVRTTKQRAFWKHRVRVSFLRSMHMAHRKMRVLERTASMGAPPSQLDYQRFPDLASGDVYPRIHSIVDNHHNQTQSDFMTPERILSKLQFGGATGSGGGGDGSLATVRADGISASEWERMEYLLAECEARGGNQMDFWNALAHQIARPSENDRAATDGANSSITIAPIYSASLEHMRALLSPSILAKMERQASMITAGSTVDYSLVPGDVMVVGRNPTLHRFNLTAAILYQGDTGYSMGQNGMKYPAFNADNDGDAEHGVVPQTEASRVEVKSLFSPANACLNIQNGSNVDGLVGDALLSLFLVSKSASMYVSEGMFLNFVRRIQLIRLDELRGPRVEQPAVDPTQFDEEEDADPAGSATPSDPVRPSDPADFFSSAGSKGPSDPTGSGGSFNYEYSLHEIHNAAQWKHLDTSPVATVLHDTHESFCRSPTRHNLYACPQPLRRDVANWTIAIPNPRKPHIRAYHLQQLVDVCLPRDFCFSGQNGELEIENGCVQPRANQCSKKYFGISDVSVWKAMHIRYDSAYVMQVKFELQSVMFDVMRFFQFAHSPDQLQMPIAVRERMNRQMDRFRRDEAAAVQKLEDEFRESFDAVINAPHRTPTLHDLHLTQSLKRSFAQRVELLHNEQTAARSSYVDRELKSWMTRFVDQFFASHPFYFADLLVQPETVAFLQRPDAAIVDPEVCRWLVLCPPAVPGGAPVPAQVVTDQFQGPLMFWYIMSGVKGKITDWANIAYSLGMQTLNDQLIRRTVEGRMSVASEFGDLRLDHNGFIPVGLATGMLNRDAMAHAQNSRAKNADASLLISRPGEMNNTLASTLGSLSATQDGNVLSETGHLVKALCGRGLLNAEVLYKLPFPVDEWVQTLDRSKCPNFIHHLTQAVRGWLNLVTDEERSKLTEADRQAQRDAVRLMYQRWGQGGQAPSDPQGGEGGSTQGGEAPSDPQGEDADYLDPFDVALRARLQPNATNGMRMDTSSQGVRGGGAPSASSFPLFCARVVDRWANRTIVGEMRLFKTPFHMAELLRIAKQRFVDTHYVAPLPEDVFDEAHDPCGVTNVESDPLLRRLAAHPDPADTSYAWNAPAALTEEVVAEQVDQLVQFMHHMIRHVEASGETPHQYPFVDQETFVREHLCLVQVRQHYALTRMQLCLLVRRMKRRFVAALVEPGTAEGPQAQHATAEPLTQLMLRVFHFVDKLQQNGGVDYVRALIQLSVRTSFLVEVALRRPDDPTAAPAVCAPFYVPIDETMSDDTLSSLFSQHAILDVIHDISNVVSRCYVPRHAGIARILSAQRTMDVDQYGSIVQYVVLPSSQSRQNMPNEYQAFYELQRDYHVPDEACRVVLSVARFRRARIDVVPFLARFCAELLNVFRVEIWRHQHAIDLDADDATPLQVDPQRDTTYVVYIRYLTPIRSADEPGILANFDQHTMQIYSTLDNGGGATSGIVAAAASPPVPVATVASVALLATEAPRSMDQAFSVDGVDIRSTLHPTQSTAAAAMAASVGSNNGTPPHMTNVTDGLDDEAMAGHQTLHDVNGVVRDASDVAGSSRRGRKQQSASSSSGATPVLGGGTATRGRGRPRNPFPTVRKPRKPTVRAPKPAKEKSVTTKTAKRTKSSHVILAPIVEESSDEEGSGHAVAPVQAVPEETDADELMHDATEDAHHTVSVPTTNGRSSSTVPATASSSVSSSVSDPRACGARAPPLLPPPLLPFQVERMQGCADMLHSTPMMGRMGIAMRRASSDVFNTPLFVQDHVFRALNIVLPHTSISSIQMIRRKTKDNKSPFADLDRTLIRFRVNASITATKLLAFLARPEFDPRTICIRDPITMHRFWGITAFSNSMVDEITKTMASAVDLDLGVVDLIVAWMTHRGYPMKMSSTGAADSGQNHTQRSLVHSSYEIIIRAAQRGERAAFNSVLSSVAVGNRVPLGTGSVSVLRAKTSTAALHRDRIQQKAEAREQAERKRAFQSLMEGPRGGAVPLHTSHGSR
jgi:hypothetical protein